MGVYVYGETRAHFISGIFRMAFFFGGGGGGGLQEVKKLSTVQNNSNLFCIQ